MNDSSAVSHVVTSADAAAHQPSLRPRQPRASLLGAVLAGTGAALLGAVAWALITAATGYQIGFMAIGVGLLVGIAVRVMGHGRTATFGAVGATFALLGCASGNLLAGCILIAQEQGMTILAVLSRLDADLAGTIMAAMFSPIDLLFYALAIFQGFKLAFDPEPDPITAAPGSAVPTTGRTPVAPPVAPSTAESLTDER